MRDVNVTASSILKLIESQSHKCALSGRDLTPEESALDHKMPLSRGGAHDLGNVWIVHREVNAAKGVMTVSEFVSMCCDIARNADAILATVSESNIASA